MERRLEEFLLDLRKEMKTKNITARAMAIELKITGVTISNVLNGKNGTLGMLNKIIGYIDSK
ncbi:MAG: hypothetical protein ACRC6A_09335 [Fusobacteriaceae bacterium]